MNRVRKLALLGGMGVAALAGAAAPARGASPPTPPGCGTAATRTAVDDVVRAIPDDGGITATVQVTGVGTHLRDADVQTTIEHTYAADLDVVLTSPAGTHVTLTADNAGDRNNVFRGTLWDDEGGDANPPGAVTDNEFQNLAVETPLVPEEALGAFVGEDPNGTWTLRVDDDNNGDTGELERWSVALTTCSAVPPSAGFSAEAAAPVALTDNSTATSTLTLGGLGSHLLDLDLRTQVAHSFAGDLDVTLTSPAGTVTTLTTDNGDGADNVFRGTVWDDDGGGPNPPGPVTLNNFENGVVEAPLVPEEAMGAFLGENPNGTWTLRVVDDNAGDTGTLESWSLAAQTEPVAPPPDRAAPLLGRLSIRPRRFRAGGRGARVGYRLSEPATVAFRVQRAARGRRAGRRCAPATRRNRRARRCTRWVSLRSGLRRRGRAGSNRFRFRGRVGGRRLRRGRYRLVATATDAAGNRSSRRSARFRIVRR